MIHGEVAPGFEDVRVEFERNFAERGELGAACAVYHRGDKVVDLWGGIRDHRTGAPWEEDTMVLVFSTTKGMAGLATAVAHSRGLLDHDERVATYWPEFAQKGKGHITVRQLLSHQAGLAAIDEPIDVKKLADLDRMAEILARQAPAWEPGTRHGYHAFSLGWYENELIRRVDPGHRSLGQFFHQEIARPLGLEFYIGVPGGVPESRIARIKGYHPAKLLLHMHTMPARMVLAVMWSRSLTARVLGNPRVESAAALSKYEFRQVEQPASGGVGEARAIARAYSVFAGGGEALGIRAKALDALTRPARPPSRGTYDLVLKTHMSYSLGFTRPSSRVRFGLSQAAFGTAGAGGSFGFADPAASIGFAYTPNKMGFHIHDDPREKALRDAVYRGVATRS